MPLKAHEFNALSADKQRRERWAWMYVQNRGNLGKLKAADRDQMTRITVHVAGRRDTSKDLLVHLAASPNPSVRRAARDNPSLSKADLAMAQLAG